MKIAIDPVFSKLLPERDITDLEELCLGDGGIREPIVVWPCGDEHFILDGHRRWKIHLKHSTLPFPKVIVLDFESRDEAHDWVIHNQRSRRNLTPEEDRYLLGKLYLKHKPKVGRPKKAEGSSAFSTAQNMANATGVSERTIREAGKFAEAVDAAEEIKDEVISGDVASTTGALRDFASLPPKHRSKAAAAITNGKVKSVKQAVGRVQKGSKDTAPTDHFKAAVPEALAPIFAQRAEFRTLMKSLGDVKAGVRRLSEEPAGRHLDLQEISRLITTAHGLIRFAMPYTECAKCRRKTAECCPACKGSGWVNETMYKTAFCEADQQWCGDGRS